MTVFLSLLPLEGVGIRPVYLPGKWTSSPLPRPEIFELGAPLRVAEDDLVIHEVDFDQGRLKLERFSPYRLEHEAIRGWFDTGHVGQD
jgi:hypothetical protein